MAASQMLTARDRDFFLRVGKIVFANPFSDARARQVREVAGDVMRPGMADAEALMTVISRRLQALDAQGTFALSDLSAEDARCAKPVFLFDVYHRHLAGMDALIERQASRRETRVDATLADRLLGELVRRGFSEEEAARYFALFHQLRRAYYFIEAGLVGESPSMKSLRRALWNNVFTHDMQLFDTHLWKRMEDFSTLLLGETGTGKGQAAAAIGRSGHIPYLWHQRRFAANFAESFIAINLSQFPETLIESELFGHRKGAFTGAIEHHDGVLARSSAHGTLLLDEIGEVSIPIQIKLLQVLQERSFTPIGSHQPQRFAGRVIAATNRPVHQLIARGEFRHDFYYRLCSDAITLPTLRQRLAEAPDELARLVGLLVTRMLGVADATVGGRVLDALAGCLPPDYPWPGNVRELEQAVRRVLLTGRYDAAIEASAGASSEALLQAIDDGRLEASALLARYCQLLYKRLGTYEEVARRTGLDRRTARKYIHQQAGTTGPA
ncbi:sigma 54-interacting transcriptional regulator [Accumulibacter sp.]|jgi:sigma-54 specific flagellar transcriptional regulator A|uniref:Putative sigma54 specific transcriptional regulator n=1 Tax=Accumulibacter regalis TaxID=522306 RepID=C7RQ84_ACCRE|nr:sigma 54-interacting transcriptional regulator [Accumulibacter sp.]MBN8497523.1 sigma-54-dependent Fis family transcriptional regulator [Accumulibacter sp.]MBO3717432.1 sigma-54-dependent Fis family transcriptional regulator [Accumulibacter sp.]